MFVHQLFEGEIKRVIAIYPGRFQPFHLGHKEVFQALQAKFGMDNVFIGTSNKTDAVKSPFNFSDKLQLMTAAGVNNHHVIEVTSPYMPDDYIRSIGFNPAETVLIFAVGAPDLQRLEVDAHYTELTPTGRPSKIPDGKSVGDPKPFKTFKSLQDCVTADQHQYVMIVNEREKKVVVNGKEFDASHGTQVRALWNEVRNDPNASAQVLKQLYGHATPELAHIFNKIPDANAAPAPAPKPSPKLKAVKVPNQVTAEGIVLTKDDLVDIYIKGYIKNHRDPITKKVGASIPNGMVEKYINALAEKFNLNPKIFFYTPTNKDMAEAVTLDRNKNPSYPTDTATQKHRLDTAKALLSDPKTDPDSRREAAAIVARLEKNVSEDAAGVGVIANKKQKNDPRYSMSMTQDVGPGEDKKNMKKLHLESNRGYTQGFASPTAPSLGRRGREDDEYHVPDPVASTWYIRANGKIIKDKMGTPYQYRDKETARKAAMTMMSKPFNAGKKFMLTTKAVDDQPVAEAANDDIARELGDIVAREDFDALYDLFSANTPAGNYVQDLYQDISIDHRLHPDDDFEQIEELVFDRLADQFGGPAINENTGPVMHRISVTVTDPNHPMVSKRGETIQKTVRVKGDDPAKAINGAIAHYRRKGYKVHDHHYIGTVDDEIKEFAPPGGDDGNDGFSDETLKRMAAQWWQGDEDPRIEKTLMAAGWEIGQDEGYDNGGVFVVQAGDVNGNSYMSWPAEELEQGIAEATGDPKFDKMLKGITGKRQVAKQQKADTKQQARDSFGGMFGGGNPADKLSIRKKGVAEGSGVDQEAGIGIDGKSFKFKIRDLVALADNYPVTKIDPQQFSKQIAGRDEDSTQSMARAEKADLQYPIIVVKRQNGQLWIADGTHRAHKAIMHKLPSINAKIIPIKDMAPFDVDQGVAEGKKPDNYHIVDKDGKPASLASYADRASAEKDRDAKHPGAQVRQVGPRGKVKGVSEGGIATVGWPDEGNHTGNNPPVSVGGTFPARPVVKKGSLVKASGLSGVYRVMDILRDEAKIVQEIPMTGQSTYVPMTDLRVWTNKPIVREQGMLEDAEELSVGDPVIITGRGIEFEGKTGDVYSFGDNKRFVIVDLYNHGKHSFHSSDVSYNNHADREDEVDESMYQYDAQDPYNSEFAPDVGMGRMTLRGWKQSLARRVAQLAQEMEQSTQGGAIDKAALWDNVYRKMQSLNLDPIAQEIELAHQELENIRRKGGVRSRAFK